jgi:hypothetical protein
MFHLLTQLFLNYQQHLVVLILISQMQEQLIPVKHTLSRVIQPLAMLLLVVVKTSGVAHAGWVVRREGTGGRAGRVHYETLVAMGSLGAQTAAYGTPATTADSNSTEDTILPDSN